ncbi:thiamine pyrophosphate-binding protein [Prosthecomicrobium hirschii]|uniref:thiamine pyrophosphate-binding protein n=1 Tax=Prosthecodimorpha hirschii TaxID=665126 RepID=UPI00221E3C3F|nr:thiamine pyrophosphate-binding protein [Prosthecomicrobium hirschii]MCW1842318.1 thiamine pyrophosphate-binding protein [Prosthecomicrobium hirschii]
MIVARAPKTVHQILAETLAQQGVETLFGLVGDANLFMTDAFVRAGSGRYVACLHEAAAVLAALGYAQVSGRTGVATITHGPALTNVVTALVEGVKGGIPIVLVCGDTPPGDTQHLQKIDQRKIVDATGAGFVEMASAATAGADLARAFRQAAAERRPVVFNMRVDLQWTAAAEEAPAAGFPPSERAAAPDGDALDDALGMIASARRPLILAGRGAIDARDALLALARRLQAPVATTLKASGLFHDDPFDLGVFGGLSRPATVDAILRADCIVAFGASLSKHTTETGAYTRDKRIVQILPDDTPNDRRTQPTLLLHGDAAKTACVMVERFDLAEIPPSGFADDDLRQALERDRAAIAEIPAFRPTRPGTVDFVPALRTLDRAIDRDRTLVADLGRFVTTGWRALPVTAPNRLVYTSHFGSIGCGLGEAIGAACATRGQTVLIVGDGGFQLSGFAELSTAVRERLDLVVIICNDGSYGAEHVQFTNRTMDPALSLIPSPDFAAVATALGAAAVTVRGTDDLAAAVALIGRGGGVRLIDLRLDPDHVDMS